MGNAMTPAQLQQLYSFSDFGHDFGKTAGSSLDFIGKHQDGINTGLNLGFGIANQFGAFNQQQLQQLNATTPAQLQQLYSFSDFGHDFGHAAGSSLDFVGKHQDGINAGLNLGFGIANQFGAFNQQQLQQLNAMTPAQLQQLYSFSDFGHDFGHAAGSSLDFVGKHQDGINA